MNQQIASLRREYKLQSLEIADVDKNPVEQFNLWFKQALEASLMEPNAMFLATADKSGQPSGRIVLLKEIANEKFIFYTNYQSRKGQEILENPLVSLTFFWDVLERQVRIEGRAFQQSEQKNLEYFYSRPKESQLGALISPQSKVISSKEVLEVAYQAQSKLYESTQIPKPEHWGGFEVVPDKIEFWQGRPSRLHDRILYSKDHQNNWIIERLAP